MARSPFQVAIFPFRKSDLHEWEYAIFRRTIESYWQSIAGGGEDEELPRAAAMREAFEEAGIHADCQYYDLQTSARVSVDLFRNCHHWDPNLLTIPIYYFGVNAMTVEIHLSHEHSEFRWVNMKIAQGMLRWDSDKSALCELEQLLHRFHLDNT